MSFESRGRHALDSSNSADFYASLCEFDENAVNRGKEVILGCISGKRIEYVDSRDFESFLRPYCASPDQNTGAKDMPTVWIDLECPRAETLMLLSDMFGIHMLTIEDCLSDREGVQKYEYFDKYRFITQTEVHDVPYSNYWSMVLVHFIVLVYPYVIFTIHNGSVSYVQGVLSRIQRYVPHKFVDKFRKCYIPCSEWILYLVIDEIVDTAIELCEKCSLEVQSLEELIYILNYQEQNDLLRRINEARRRMTALRLQLNKKSEIIVHLIATSWISPVEDEDEYSDYSSESKLLEGDKVQLYLRDVLDHITSAISNLEESQESLLHLTSTYLTKISNEITFSANLQNYLTQKMTALATIVLPATLIPSMWGMNVKVPLAEMSEYNGFIIISASLTAFVIAMLLFFKIIKWL